MLSRRIKGNAIPQYTIIIAMIALAVVPGFYLIGKTIYDQFAGYAEIQKSNNDLLNARDSEWGKAIINGTLTAGQLGGKPGEPVRKCLDGVCAIDYGKIVLNNIPDNYGEIIETSGTAGGGNIILGVMSDIAKQMEANPEEFPPDQVAKIKALMAQGKDIVTMEKYVENKIAAHQEDLKNFYADQQAYIAELKASECDNNISYSTYYAACQPFREKLYALRQKYEPVIEDIYGGTDAPLITTAGGQQLKLNMSNIRSMLSPNNSVIIRDGSIGVSTTLKDQVNIVDDPRYEMYQKMNFDDYMNGNILLEANQPADFSEKFNLSTVGEYLKQVKEIMQDPEASPAVQDVTRELSREIFDLTKTFNDKTSNVAGGISILSLMEMDYYYGYYRGYTEYAQAGLEKAQSSLGTTQAPVTRLDLAVICGSTRGQFNADNVSCQQQSSSNSSATSSST